MNKLDKDKTPLISIFVLTYKKFDHIYKNIDSILVQKYPNIEIIVSDDGSGNFPKDEICAYIEKHRGPNIQNIIILDNKVNVGTVRHINSILNHANGEVFAPLSQDDEFCADDVVERIMKRFIEQPFNVLLTSRYGVDKDGKIIGILPHIKSRSCLEKMTTDEMFCAFSESRFKGMASGSAMYYRTSFLKEFGPFDERYILWEDGPFVHKCLRLGKKIDTAYEIVTIYYEQTEGISRRPKVSSVMEKDVELYLNTDFQKGANGYGVSHKRYISFFNKKRSCKSKIELLAIYIAYFDVFLKKLFFSDKFKKWDKYDKKWLRYNFLASPKN